MAEAPRSGDKYKPLEKTMLPKKPPAASGAEPPKKTPLGGSASMVDLKARLEAERRQTKQGNGGTEPADLTTELTSEIDLLPTDTSSALPLQKPASHSPQENFSGEIQLAPSENDPPATPVFAAPTPKPSATDHPQLAAQQSAMRKIIAARAVKAQRVEKLVQGALGRNDVDVIFRPGKNDGEGSYQLHLPPGFAKEELTKLGLAQSSVDGLALKGPYTKWFVDASVAIPPPDVLRKKPGLESAGITQESSGLTVIYKIKAGTEPKTAFSRHALELISHFAYTAVDIQEKSMDHLCQALEIKLAGNTEKEK